MGLLSGCYKHLVSAGMVPMECGAQGAEKRRYKEEGSELRDVMKL